MFSGLLKEKIEIYNPTISINDYGQKYNDLELVYTTRANVSHLRGRRSVIDDEIQTPYEKQFIVRIYVPISDDSQIKYNGKFYRVTEIDVDKEYQRQVISAEIVNE